VSVSLKLLFAAAVFAAALCAVRAASSRDPSRRGFEFLPEMTRTPAKKAFAESAAFEDGAAMRPIRDGVVLYGDEADDFGPGADEAARAGRELKNPFASTDAAALARGATVFARRCAHCHGLDGEGRTPVVARGMLPPPSLKGARAAAMADGEVVHLIEHGRGTMAGFGDGVSIDDRFRVAWHLRVLRGEVK
jgi:mono/diheme cytochrome c family protein